MKDTKKKYWKGLEELNSDAEFVQRSQNEFPELLNSDNEEGPNRRDFLKLMGFSVAAASLVACEAPIRKAIPYVTKPVEVDPSVPNYYASTYAMGGDYANVVVKTREGRPIKVQANELSSFSGSGVSAQVEASVLSLYDKERLTGPLVNQKASDWKTVDAAVTKSLASGKPIAFVSYSLNSPSTLKTIQELSTRYGNVDAVQYDAISYDGILTANERSFGKRAMPTFDFSKARTIVSFGADFLGTWGNHSLSNKQFADSKRIKNRKTNISRLYSFETNLSLTGSNADYRQMVKPSELPAYIGNLYNFIASELGAEKISVSKVSNDKTLKRAAKDLLSSSGKSLVVSGSNDPSVQILINGINVLLKSYGNTIDLNNVDKTRQGSDKKLIEFVRNLKAGKFGTVIFYSCNPVFDTPYGDEITKGLKKAGLVVSTSDRLDETSSLAGVVAPENHYLESWNDFELTEGTYSFSQPTISNLFNTRQAQDSFLTWAGSTKDYLTLLKENWSDEASWDQLLQDGVLLGTSELPHDFTFSATLSEAASSINAVYKPGKGLEIALYQTIAIGTGYQGNNPWLQEMSDPITKACWENYVTLSPKQADELGLKTSDLDTETANIKIGSSTMELPVIVQPGQAYGTIGIALGFGRKVAGKVANELGKDLYPFVKTVGGYRTYDIISGAQIELTGKGYRVAKTQTSQTVIGRSAVIQETSLTEYKKDPNSIKEEYQTHYHTSKGHKEPIEISLWKGHKYPNHHWGMAVDLNTCTGCGSCTIACQVENNIPVVGKEEVLNRREMAWLRIDRYYSSEVTDGLDRDAEIAEENPEVVFQPMMCQQCNNAPCETVCPVAATTHSSEGLNQMTYNRCIGTRYCANNCPYKVRRFNWFKYHDNKQFPDNLSMNNDLGKMVLNPDVTVRARGVMEKCSFCIQRIQAGKLEAKKDGRRPNDADIQSACSEACPSNAITFGDLNNPETAVSQLLKIEKDEAGRNRSKEPRAYHVLEDLRVDPNVWYLTKVRNKEQNS